MRVCIDVRSLLDDQLSGIGNYTFSLVEALLRENPEHRFLLFANAWKGTSHHIEKLRQYPNGKLILTRIPNKLLHSLFVLFRIPSLEKLCGQADVYFFPNIIYLPRLAHPSVLTVHDVSYVHMPHVYSLRSRIWHRVVRARTLLKQADALLAVSQATAWDLANTFPHLENKINIVPSALTVTEKQTLLPPRHFLILGNIEERKNIFGILAAYKQFKQKNPQALPLLFVGRRGFLRARTKKLLVEAREQGIARESGYISEKEKLDTILSAQALVFPSLYEGFGFPALEAKNVGIPVISSSRTSLPEVLKDSAIYVDPHRLESLIVAFEVASKMQRVLSPTMNTRSWNEVASDTMNVLIKTANAYADRN